MQKSLNIKIQKELYQLTKKLAKENFTTITGLFRKLILEEVKKNTEGDK